MSNDKGWLKLWRRITEWEHFKGDSAVVHVWIWLLVNANTKPGAFLGTKIGVGCLATSYDSVAYGTGLSRKTVYRVLKKLEETGEIKLINHGRFSEVQILHFLKCQEMSKIYTSRDTQSKNNKEEEEKENKKESQPCLTQADEHGQVWS